MAERTGHPARIVGALANDPMRREAFHLETE